MKMIFLVAVIVIIVVCIANAKKANSKPQYCQPLDTVIELIKPMVTGATKGGSRNATSIQVISSTGYGKSGVYLIVRHPLREDDEFEGAIRRAFKDPGIVSSTYYQMIVDRFELTRSEREAYLGTSASNFCEMLKGESVDFYNYDSSVSFPVLIYKDSVSGWTVGSCLIEFEKKCKKLFPDKTVRIISSTNCVEIQ